VIQVAHPAEFSLALTVAIQTQNIALMGLTYATNAPLTVFGRLSFEFYIVCGAYFLLAGWICNVVLMICVVRVEAGGEISIYPGMILGMAAIFTGTLISRAQLEKTIGLWIVDINPIFHLWGGVATSAIRFDGGLERECKFNDEILNCGPLAFWNLDGAKVCDCERLCYYSAVLKLKA
jgi:hypothetical protein